MAVKSVIDIEINDGNFKDFQKKFEQYQATLKSMPREWGAVGKAVIGSGKPVADFGARIKAVANAIKDAKTSGEKFNLALKAADRTATSLGRGMKTIATYAKEATVSLLKWGGILTSFGGLLAGGGLFGIGKLAETMAERQRGTAATGVGESKMKAMQVTYGQMMGGEGGVASSIGAIDTMMHKAGGQQLLRNILGANYNFENKDAAEILKDYIASMRQQFKNMPKGMELTSPFFANQELNPGILSEEQAKGIFRPGDKNGYMFDLANLRSEEASRERKYQMGEGTVSAWANIKKTFDDVGEVISSSFAKGLQPLLPGLTAFANTFADAVKHLLGTDVVKKWVGKANQGLKNVASYMSTPEFGKDMDAFLEGVDRAGGALWDFAQLIYKATGMLMGGSLTASQHRDIEKIRAIDPAAAKLAEASMRDIGSAEKKKAAVAEINRYISQANSKTGLMTENQKTLMQLASNLHFTTILNIDAEGNVRQSTNKSASNAAVSANASAK